MKKIVSLLKIKSEKEVEEIKEVLKNLNGSKIKSEEIYTFPEGEVKLTIDLEKMGMLIAVDDGIESIPKFQKALKEIEML